MIATLLSKLGLGSVVRYAAIAAVLAALAVGGWLMWTRRGAELHAAQAQAQAAEQAKQAAIAAVQADQATIARIRADAARQAAALAATSATEQTQAAQAAAISAQVTAAPPSENGAVAPVLARALRGLAKAQGAKP